MYRTFAIRSAILSLIVNLGFLWLVNDAMSADYYTMSVGQSTLNRNTQFGWWNQQTSDQHFNETSPSWAIRAGWDVTPHLQLEAGWRDLGKFSTVGSFISDTGYANAMNGLCTFPCGEDVVSVYGEGRAYGADVRAKLSHDLGAIRLPEVRIYGGLGLFAYHSTYHTAVIRHDNSGKIYPDNRWSENRIRPSYSIGIEYGKAFVEYTIDRHVGTEFSAFDKAQTLHLGVRF